MLHSTPGPVSPRVPHLTDADAADLLRTQASRARAARTLAGPERWMQAPEPHPSAPSITPPTAPPIAPPTEPPFAPPVGPPIAAPPPKDLS